MALFAKIKSAFQSAAEGTRAALVNLRPPTIAGPLPNLLEHNQYEGDVFGKEQPSVSARAAQDARVRAYEEWRQQGERRSLWTTWVAFYQIASGQWIPVHSSNVSAFRWTPLRRDQTDVMAPPHVEGGVRHPWFRDMMRVGQGHGNRLVNIKGRSVDANDLATIRQLLTPAELRAYERRMYHATPLPQDTVRDIDPGFISRLSPTVAGNKITESTQGLLFVRYHDTRIYLYPMLTMGEALKMYQAPSKGRFCWQALRWSGRPYQQIAGPPVQYRQGIGR